MQNIIGGTWHNFGIGGTSIISANEQLKKTCYEEGVRFVDLFGEMEINQANRTTFLYDRTHPNANGKERYSECLAKHIY
ncbi:MAG: SGNH/GDSL hydrolase family protein [Bacilli bacterium]